jgi:sugar-specific transcriptional regulator TrmB
VSPVFLSLGIYNLSEYKMGFLKRVHFLGSKGNFLGLGLNQARVYLAILKLEKATVGQVAKFSKVRREEVYRIMPTLEKMGLIERLVGKPTVIRATPISDALSFLVAEEETKSYDRLTGMRGRIQKLSLKDWKQPLLGEESIYILITEKKAILGKTSELIRKSFESDWKEAED